MAINYQTIKVLAKENGLTVQDLLALAPNNDPFYTGRPSEIEAANWFAELWGRFGYSRNVHLRRIHYQVVSQRPQVTRPNGEKYENTEKDWNYLTNAGKWARYLGLVSPDAFVDRRNPEAIINAFWNEDETPDYGLIGGEVDADEFGLPGLPELPALPRGLPDPASFWVDGYRRIQQPVHIEVWVEKTTMNDVLAPLCGRWGVNLVTGAGELSITAVRTFLDRVVHAGRPARILYVSDFDPAGLGMPVSVARKIEFFQRTDGFGSYDIALHPIVLTADQIDEFDLPRVPVKDSDLRKANFEAAHGEGQVELDALEALYPGELARIVEAAILRYVDNDLRNRALSVETELKTELERRRRGILGEYSGVLYELHREYRDLYVAFDGTREKFSELVAQFMPQLEEHRTRLEEIVQAAHETYGDIESDLERVDVDMEEYALPEAEIDGDPDGLLYSSGRDYVDQLKAYKALRNGIEG